MAKKQVPQDIKVELPAPKQERTIAEIQQEYANQAAKLGQTSYQLHILGKESELLKQQMQNLNFEASAIQAKQPAKEQTNG